MVKCRYIFPVFILLLSGCEKIIDIDLNDTNPVIVIEGSLNDVTNSATVDISKTTSYFDTDTAELITDATVQLEDEAGNSYNLVPNAEGTFYFDDFFASAGQEYTLTVEIDDEVYQSSSTLHQTVFIDSLSAELNEEYSILQDAYNVNLYFHDPPQENNYYRLKIFVNGELQNDADDFVFFDDSNINGKLVEVHFSSKIFYAGDTVTYELQTLDEAAYEYFDAVSELINDYSIGSASPANPESNFSNGALGYFSAYSYDTKDIIIPED